MLAWSLVGPAGALQISLGWARIRPDQPLRRWWASHPRLVRALTGPGIKRSALLSGDTPENLLVDKYLGGLQLAFGLVLLFIGTAFLISALV